MKKQNKKIVAYSAGIFTIFIIWFLLSIFINNDYVIPSIGLTLKALGNLLKDSNTYRLLGLSFLRLIICLTISFILGLIISALTIKFNALRSFFSPGITIVKTIPNIIIIIFLLIVFNSEVAIYVITCFVVFPILYEGIYGGFTNIDKDLLEDIKTVSNFNFSIARKIYVPLSLPFILTSLLQSFGLGLKVTIMAEYISQANNTIGKELMFYKNYSYETEYILAWTLIFVVIVLVVDLVLSQLKKKLN